MTDYFVKDTGSDLNTGLSDAQAWKTIGEVNDAAFANSDTVSFKRGSTFDDETLTLHSTPAGRTGIVVQDYDTGNKPLFDGNVIQPILIDHALVNFTLKNIDVSGWNYGPGYGDRDRVRLNNINGLIIDGVDFDGHQGANTFACIPTLDPGECVDPLPTAFGVHMILDIKDIDGDITIKNCNIKNILKAGAFSNSRDAWCKGDLKAVRISISDYSGGGKTTGIVYIYDNDFRDIYSDHLQINGIQVPQYIYDNDFIGFGENFIDVKSSKYGKVYNNNISGQNIGKDPGGGTYGPNVSTFHDSGHGLLPWGDYEIYNNYIYDTYASGIYLNASTYHVHHNYIKNCLCGIRIYGSNCRIHNNVIETTSSTLQDPDGNYTGAYRSGILVYETYSHSNHIYNNTLILTSDLIDYGIAIQSCSTGTTNSVKNNIIYMSKNHSAVYPIWWNGTGTTPTVDHNVCYNPNHTNRVYWSGTTYDNTEQADWITAGHAGAVFTDPVFVSVSSDFSLQSGSPAINTGSDLGTPYNLALNPSTTWPDGVVTADQDDYGSAWEMGAYVYGATPEAAAFAGARGINKVAKSFQPVGRRYHK